MQKHSGLMRAAIDKYNMIDEGDRIAVGVSGGKDSLALLWGLVHLRRYYPKKFQVVALTADPCFEGKEADYSLIENFCKENDVEYIIRRTELAKVVFEEKATDSPCSLCAKMRRGILHDMAKAQGCNKLALGHHSDDAAETMLMNLFCGGNVACFRPVTYLSIKDITVIRPMIFCDESKITSLAERYNFPVVKSKCPMDKNTERERTGNLIKELSERYPDLKSKILGALERGSISGW
ncbi:MAG: tRNA 2-thiocytidine biosynthesis protein TtcA [Ruminococcus sp.]|nr:tRNA 2-thiocytidine biosynthesis protein TtcA [Ruminococcus sp.]